MNNSYLTGEEKERVRKGFRKELQALLEKYNATLETTYQKYPSAIGEITEHKIQAWTKLGEVSHVCLMSVEGTILHAKDLREGEGT